jgi:hypothetical protein
VGNSNKEGPFNQNLNKPLPKVQKGSDETPSGVSRVGFRRWVVRAGHLGCTAKCSFCPPGRRAETRERVFLSKNLPTLPLRVCVRCDRTEFCHNRRGKAGDSIPRYVCKYLVKVTSQLNSVLCGGGGWGSRLNRGSVQMFFAPHPQQRTKRKDRLVLHCC